MSTETNRQLVRGAFEAMGRSDIRPGADEGWAAARSARTRMHRCGAIGAGTGATVAKLAGLDCSLKGGLGTASERLADGTVVGALAVVNAVGEVVRPEDGAVLAAGNGLLIFDAFYGRGATMDAPPDVDTTNRLDLEVPANEAPALRQVLAEMKRADFLFTSLGCLQADPAYEKLAPRPHKYLLDNLKLTEASLLKEGAVGDFNYSFFTADGTTAPEWNIFPALGVEQAQAMVKAQKTVVVAAGRYKMAALRSALQGRLFNVLITDELAAKELLGGD